MTKNFSAEELKLVESVFGKDVKVLENGNIEIAKSALHKADKRHNTVCYTIGHMKNGKFVLRRLVKSNGNAKSYALYRNAHRNSYKEYGTMREVVSNLVMYLLTLPKEK